MYKCDVSKKVQELITSQGQIDQVKKHQCYLLKRKFDLVKKTFCGGKFKTSGGLRNIVRPSSEKIRNTRNSLLVKKTLAFLINRY